MVLLEFSISPMGTGASVSPYVARSLDIIDLPARGIHGNSHFPMMDDNSDAVAALVQDWIESKGLMK